MWPQPIYYDKTHHKNLREKFAGSSKISRNFSQCYQDMFVLTMLNGQKDGQFLEIGCGHPYFCNNTVLLEKLFGWTGISIDKNDHWTEIFRKYRNSRVITSDATILNFEDILDSHDYDYLQIDCEPPHISFEILLRIPFNIHRFAVITFEHDFYADKYSGVMEKSRNYLHSLGYSLIANNIAPDKESSFEDWWVHPEIVHKKIISSMICLTDLPKRADDYMLNRLEKCHEEEYWK